MFRHIVIEPSLCCKYDIIFSNIVAIRQYAWILFFYIVLFEDDGRDDDIQNVNDDDDANLKEESGN